jgi:hypothetical protein
MFQYLFAKLTQRAGLNVSVPRSRQVENPIGVSGTRRLAMVAAAPVDANAANARRLMASDELIIAPEPGDRFGCRLLRDSRLRHMAPEVKG